MQGKSVSKVEHKSSQFLQKKLTIYNVLDNIQLIKNDFS